MGALVDVELRGRAGVERNEVARLGHATALGQRPQRLEAPRVDRELLLRAQHPRARLDRQHGLFAAPAQAHLDPVVAHREIALLDPLALGESRGEPIHQELALDLDA